jgi:hypothetical protein
MPHFKPRQNISAHIRQNEVAYSPDDAPPRFSFRYLVKHADFGFESLDAEHKVALVNTMYKLSQLPWKQLRLAPRHGLGYEEIARDSLRFALPAAVTEDKTIVAFRFHAKAPMLGYRSAWGTFYIVAFDSRFLAYRH